MYFGTYIPILIKKNTQIPFNEHHFFYSFSLLKLLITSQFAFHKFTCQAFSPSLLTHRSLFPVKRQLML